MASKQGGLRTCRSGGLVSLGRTHHLRYRHSPSLSYCLLTNPVAVELVDYSVASQQLNSPLNHNHLPFLFKCPRMFARILSYIKPLKMIFLVPAHRHTVWFTGSDKRLSSPRAFV